MSKQVISRLANRQTGPLSFQQEGLWFLSQLDPASPRYNVARGLRLRGALVREALQGAVNEIVRRHQTLRSRFIDAGGKPMQTVERNVTVPVTFVDLADEPDREARLRSVCGEQIGRPFDLSRDALLRASLIRMTERDHALVFVMPHIACDGWSLINLVREFLACYEMLSTGRPPALPDLPVQYLDYVAWQRQWATGKDLERQLAYWREKLASMEPLDLPTDRPRPAQPTMRNGALPFRLSKELSERLKALARAETSTLFMTLLAAFQALLSRYTSQTDVAVGVPIANRRFVELEGLVGFFANTLVMRGDLRGDPTFHQWLARVKAEALAAYEHADLPFERLVQELQPNRDLSRNPLFQTLFQLRNYPKQITQAGALEAEPIELPSAIAKFDLVLAMSESADGLKAIFEYNLDLFEPATIARLFGHFQTLLEAICAEPEKRLSELTLLTEAERRQVVAEWNRTQDHIQPDACIHRMFEEQAAKSPHAIAVVCGAHAVTYRELNRRSNQLARRLRSCGVQAETLVAICMNRSIGMIAAMLAVLKAGGAYVPLDPAYPRERMLFILQDTQAPVLLTQAGVLAESAIGMTNFSLVDGSLPDGRKPPIKLIDVDAEDSAFAEPSDENLASLAAPENLAYVIYTSGSTGIPKGVMIEHRNAAAFLQWAHRAFTPEDLAGVLATTSICFDLSVFEIFAPLTAGGRVLLLENALAVQDMDAAVAPSLLNTVPSAMAELLRLSRLPNSIRAVSLAGEPLTPDLVAQIARHTSAQKIFDLYGPSETTTYSTWSVRKAPGPQTIGRPIANTQIYILDPHGNPVPIGVPGEIYIGGSGVARGYLNRPALTAERFLPNPFQAGAGAWFYRTGDIARYSADGNIQLIGRRDDQVKIRGFRVELGEIEAALSRHFDVRESVVLGCADHTGNKRLVAYVVARASRQSQAEELKHFLKKTLPEYMIPGAWVHLDSLPHMPNGKIDRAALPPPETRPSGDEGAFVAPRTAAETSIATVWAEVLEVERVGIYDNFFELGGHSLLAAQVVSRLQQAFEVELPLRALFDQQTVSELAETISIIRENTSEAKVNEPTLRIEFPSEEKGTSTDEAGKTNI
jgi:amino acid adenylation domain-containing protein